MGDGDGAKSLEGRTGWRRGSGLVGESIDGGLMLRANDRTLPFNRREPEATGGRLHHFYPSGGR